MKRKLLVPIILAVTLFFTSGCAFHGGMMNTSASLNSANFSYVSHDAMGSSSATYIFGFGGLSKSSLVAEAKKDMLRTPLKNNQALANVSVNFKRTFIMGIYAQTKCIVTADIVEFSK